MGLTCATRACLGFVAAAILTAAPLGARQTPIPGVAQQMLSQLSPQEIQDRIQATGLTAAQIRERLRRAGYDPSLADAYLDGSTGSATAGPQSSEFLEALRSIGISLRMATDEVPGAPVTSLEGGPPVLRDAEPEIEVDSTGLPVFGKEVFRRRTTEFDPVLTGPVGPDYRLGPGDELILILTGDVELAYRLDVTREGYVVIPDVGQVFVNGLTMGQLKERLYGRLGRVYSGVKPTADATTRFDLSLGRLRTDQVYVVGEVERPGAYQVSSVATILEALYAAGGPKASGSFRRILLRRGGTTAGEFDLYRYLTAGETPVALRMEEGDVVFVPPIGIQITLRGEVTRPARYELIEGERLPDLIQFAGGLKPSASQERLQVDRILPAGQRTEGQDRAILDVDYEAVASGAMDFPLHSGDGVTVFPVLSGRRGWVRIQGAVYRPGTYELRPGMTVASLLARAGGPLPDALELNIHVSRLNPDDGTRSLLRGTLASAQSIPLAEFDEVTLFSQDSLTVADSVRIFGIVQRPGTYTLAAGATAEDVILLAGGFARGADPRQAEVVRTRGRVGDDGWVGRSVRVRLSGELPYPDAAVVDSLPPLDAGSGGGAATAQVASVPLQSGDEIYVRLLPNYRVPRRVSLEGEVLAPGTYVLERSNERLTSVLHRAGGLTAEAFPGGVRLIRDGITVAMDVERALDHPEGVDDPVLADGDRLVVPIYDPTVLVTGAVQFSTRVTYRNGMDLGDVLSAAGGLTSEADGGRVSVEYANGQRATIKHFLGLTVSTPRVRPGSSVYVPEKASGAGFDWDTALTRILAVTSTMATLYIAVHR